MTEELLKALLKNPLCSFNELEHTQYIQALIDEYLSQEEQEKYQDDLSHMTYLAQIRAFGYYDATNNNLYDK